MIVEFYANERVEENFNPGGAHFSQCLDHDLYTDRAGTIRGASLSLSSKEY